MAEEQEPRPGDERDDHIAAAVERVRRDKRFIEIAERIMERDKEILDRLADS